MDLGTIIGLLSGTAIIIIGILLSGGDLFWFTQFNALIIVLGGTLAATMVNLPIHAVGNLFAVIKNVFTDEVYDYKSTIDEIVLKLKRLEKMVFYLLKLTCLVYKVFFFEMVLS